ncbi:MAG: hypothetical protein QGH74_05785 [Candidatus Brocadiia bacterium]|nr:hypothetical protein [Candidatus Brocadiia bacterium]
MSSKKRRVLYNDDGGSIIFYPHPYQMTLDQYYDCVDQLIGTHVDTYILCLGSPTNCRDDEFAGKRLDAVEKGTAAWRNARNILHLRTLGIDPHTALLQRAKDRGLRAIASIRMNDAHYAYSPQGPEKVPTVSPFWLEHPEYRIDPEVDTARVLRETQDWKRILYDYSHPEVQQYVLDRIDEFLERTDPDGLELDFMRHPFYFKPEEAPEKLGRMTEFVRRVRARLDEIEEATGQHRALGALVPVTVEAGRRIGLDGITWIKEGLLDYIAPKHFIEFVMDARLDEFVSAARNTRTEVYPCLENWPTGEARERPIESFRGAAAHYWDIGVDGIYVYNYFNHRPHPFSKEDRHILEEIGDPDVLMWKDKRYALVSVNFIFEDEGWQVPLEVSGSHIIRFSLGGETPTEAEEWPLRSDVLRLTFEKIVVEEDVLEFQLNGAVIPSESFKAVFDPACYDFRCIECDLSGLPLLKSGENGLGIELKRRCPGVSTPLVLTEVEVITSYR